MKAYIDQLQGCLIITIFLLFVFTTCTSTEQIVSGTNMNESEKQYSYLALGDSYTIGESVDFENNFPAQLNARLINDGVKMSAVEIIAKTGWRTDQLKDAIGTSGLEDTFSIVSLLIGVNNQYQGRPIIQYETEFEQLLDIAIHFANGDPNKVFVVSIPDYYFTPFGQNRPNGESISTELDQYNGIAKTFAEQKGVSYFNITPISRQGIEKPELVAGDGLHPSGEMYKQWVDLLYDEVKEKLDD